MARGFAFLQQGKRNPLRAPLIQPPGNVVSSGQLSLKQEGHGSLGLAWEAERGSSVDGAVAQVVLH